MKSKIRCDVCINFNADLNIEDFSVWIDKIFAKADELAKINSVCVVNVNIGDSYTPYHIQLSGNKKVDLKRCTQEIENYIEKMGGKIE